MAGYLNTEHHIPYKRLCEILEDLFNLHISEGTVHNLWQSIKSSSAGIYQQIRQRIESCSVVGADETGANINGKLHGHRSFQTDSLTYIYPDQSGGKAAIDKHFPNGLPNPYPVTDRHSSYFNMDVKGHQICIAHLLRELTYLQELVPQASWPEKMKKLLQEAIHKRKTREWHLIDRQAIIEKFEELLFCCTKHLNRAIGILQNSLIKHRENVFSFLFNPQIPYDNNASERSIRPLKLKEKVSGGFRSNGGALAYAVIHSIADTAKKNQLSPFLALKAVTQYTQI
jgi:hypothetical protein